MPDYEKIAESVELAPENMELAPEGPEWLNLLGEVIGLEGELTEEVVEEEVVLTAAPREQVFYPLDHPKYQGIAAAKGYNQETARIIRTHYSHEAMIDVIIAEPTIKQNELAARFEKSVPWISRIIGSDAFQGALVKRREELTDPFLVATIEERFRGLAMQSLDVIAEKLAATQNVDVAMKALDISSKALGFGARNAGAGNTQNNFVIHLPVKSVDAASWAAEHSSMKQLN